MISTEPMHVSQQECRSILERKYGNKNGRGKYEQMKKRLFEKPNNRIVLILAVCLLMLPAAGGCSKKEASVTDLSLQDQSQSQAVDNTLEWRGKKYAYNENLTNILFLGVDKTEPIDLESVPGEAGQSDCIMLLSLDEETKQAQILQINRNAMTELDIYDLSGNYLKSAEGQLALQYAYNIGGSSSCWAVKKTVSEMLYSLSIDGYFAMDMSGIPEINDALGGVDVTMKEDYSRIDDSFTEGSTVHLMGEMAQKFVRYRDIDEFNSVEDRMHRQVDYITAMISSMKSSGGRKLYDILSPYLDTYIITDLDADQLNALTSYDYLTDEVQYLPGEPVKGDVYEEFYIDEEELQDLLIQMFYEEVPES